MRGDKGRRTAPQILARAAACLIMLALLAHCAPVACPEEGGCSQNTIETSLTETAIDGGTEMHGIDEEEALEIARQDALIAYRDLDIYDVSIELEDGRWKIDYALKDTSARGGGPHYIISQETGEIISKRYEQ